jgi:2-haloacid dehalogenase
VAGRPEIKALVFDVFGTVVDWRTSVARHAEALAKAKGVTLDPIAFAEAWRGRYQPQLETVRSGQRPWTILDVLHRESLVALLPQFGLEGKLSEAEIDSFNKAWHDLTPWPDVVAGLIRLKKKFIIGPQSNGNIAIMVNLAKKQGLPWDVILGAEVVRNYKPVPQSYTDCCRRNR